MASLVRLSLLVAFVSWSGVAATGKEDVLAILDETLQSRSIPKITEARCIDRFDTSVREALAETPRPNLDNLSPSFISLGSDLALCIHISRTKSSLTDFIFGPEYKQFHEHLFQSKYPPGFKRITSPGVMKDILIPKVIQALEESGLEDAEGTPEEAYQELITDFQEDLWRSLLPDPKFDIEEYQRNFEIVLRNIQSHVAQRSRLRPPASMMDAIEEVLGAIVANETSDFDVTWAEEIARQWRTTRIRDLEIRLRRIFSKNLKLPSCDFESEEVTSCLRNFIAGVVLLESAVRREGVSLRYAPAFSGANMRSFLGSVVTRVLEKTETQLFTGQTDARRSMAPPPTVPAAKTNFQDMVYVFRTSMVSCLDLAREKIDESDAVNVTEDVEVSDCLKGVRAKGNGLANSLVSGTEPANIEPERLIKAKNKMIDRFFLVQVKLYKRLRLLKQVVRDFMRQGVLARPENPESSWPWKLVHMWETSTTVDTDQRLMELFGDGSFANVKCTLEEFPEITVQAFTSSHCWRPLLQDLLVIESILRQDGQSLEMIFYGHPVLMSYIYIVDKELANAASPRIRMGPRAFETKAYRFGETTKEDLRLIAAKYESFLKAETEDLNGGPAGTVPTDSSISLSADTNADATDKEDRYVGSRRGSVIVEPYDRVPGELRSMAYQYVETDDDQQQQQQQLTQRNGGIMDAVRSTVVQSMIGAVTGVISDSSPVSKTVLGGLAGRLADVITYPILGDTASKVVRGSVQQATDTLTEGVYSIFG